MSTAKKLLTGLFIAIFSLTVVITPVHAQFDLSNGVGICDFIGPVCKALGISDDEGAAGQVFRFARDRIALVISLIFVAIILISVFVIIRAAIKYIQSQGEDKEIQSAQKAIKSVFMGIAALFVGVIGIVLVLIFFNGSGLLNTGGSGSGCTFDQETGRLINCSE